VDSHLAAHAAVMRGRAGVARRHAALPRRLVIRDADASRMIGSRDERDGSSPGLAIRGSRRPCPDRGRRPDGSSPGLAIRERPVTRLFLGSRVAHWTARLAPSSRSGAFRRLLGADVGAVEPRPGFSHESIEADPVLALVALLELGVDVERHLRVGVADLAHHPLHIEAGARRRAPAASRQFPTRVQPPHPNPAARALSTAEADANQVAGKGDVEPAGQNEASMGVTPGPRTDRRPRCSQSGLAPFPRARRSGRSGRASPCACAWCG
jgi:hypothetical protein